MSLNLAAVLLLPRTGVLKPDLRDPLAETGHLGYSFEILAVGVAVQLEVGLENRELLLGKGRPHALRLAALAAVLGVAVLRRRRVVALDHVEVMRLAEKPGVQERELLAGGQLTGASVAGEAGQMIDPVLGPPYPIPGAHAAPALGAFRAESSANTNSGVTNPSTRLSLRQALGKLIDARNHRQKVFRARHQGTPFITRLSSFIIHRFTRVSPFGPRSVGHE